MTETFDFSNGQRGPVDPTPAGKTRITIRLDNDILDWFRAQVHTTGGGNYQTLINQALRQHLLSQEMALEETLRRVVRDELERTLLQAQQNDSAIRAVAKSR